MSVLLPVNIIFFRVVDIVVQAAALLALERTADDQFGDRGDVAQFDQVGGDQEIPVIIGDLFLDHLHAAQGPDQALVRADDADIVPHAEADFVPVVGNHHLFVAVFCAAGVPGGDGRGRG